MNTTEQQPPMWHQGQPYSMESAAKALAEFDADADRVKAALNGDVAKQQERAAYREMAMGRQIGVVPAMPADSAAVAQQMDEREEQIREAVNDTWRGFMNMTPEREAELKAGVASKEWIDHAKRELVRMKRDTEFKRKVAAGDRDAVDVWSRMHKLAYGMREVVPQ